ncbi:TPA: ABC transporter substrate-binding protein, partial [Klebsiella michiganensis]
KNKMNPTMADEEQAYNEGLKQGIRLIGEVVGRQAQAEALIQYTFSARRLANAPVADIPQNERVRVYMANPDLNTYGSGKYTGLMMKHAGALNVAAASVKGARQVSLEQVLQWDPQVIFVQDRYPEVVKHGAASPGGVRCQLRAAGDDPADPGRRDPGGGGLSAPGCRG